MNSLVSTGKIQGRKKQRIGHRVTYVDSLNTWANDDDDDDDHDDDDHDERLNPTGNSLN